MKLRGKHIIKNRELFLRRVALVFLDILVILVSMAGALWIRFDFSFTQIEPVFLESVREYLYINMVTTLFLFWLFRLYSSLWRFGLRGAGVHSGPGGGDVDPGSAGSPELSVPVSADPGGADGRGPFFLPLYQDHAP